MSDPTANRLLIVDDEKPLVSALCVSLQLEGYAVEGHTSPSAALASISPDKYALIITDLMMPEMDGMSVLRAAMAIDPAMVGIVMTGHGTIDTAVKALQLGALDYLQKPFNLDVARAVVTRALGIRELRRDNARLIARERQHLAALENAYQDLKAFSVSVSHDLRAPLRAIMGFMNVYLQDHGDGIPAAGRRHLDLVVASAARMDRMIEGLMRLCRCSQQSLSKSPVNMTELVTHIAEELLSRSTDHTPNIRIDTLPECDVDVSLIEQVFFNLLSNAFKFTRQVASPCIQISAETRDGETAFTISDNGAGFNMQYAQRLFGLFQRLHSDNEFEGTGVGLSIVKRIVERHGGEISASGVPGGGASFRFTLPSVVADDCHQASSDAVAQRCHSAP